MQLVSNSMLVQVNLFVNVSVIKLGTIKLAVWKINGLQIGMFAKIVIQLVQRAQMVLPVTLASLVLFIKMANVFVQMVVFGIQQLRLVVLILVCQDALHVMQIILVFPASTPLMVFLEIDVMSAPLECIFQALRADIVIANVKLVHPLPI